MLFLDALLSRRGGGGGGGGVFTLMLVGSGRGKVLDGKATAEESTLLGRRIPVICYSGGNVRERKKDKGGREPVRQTEK